MQKIKIKVKQLWKNNQNKKPRMSMKLLRPKMQSKVKVKILVKMLSPKKLRLNNLGKIKALEQRMWSKLKKQRIPKIPNRQNRQSNKNNRNRSQNSLLTLYKNRHRLRKRSRNSQRLLNKFLRPLRTPLRVLSHLNLLNPQSPWSRIQRDVRQKCSKTICRKQESRWLSR